MIYIELMDEYVLTNDKQQFIVNKKYKNPAGIVTLIPIKFFPDTHSLFRYIQHSYIFNAETSIEDIRHLGEIIKMSGEYVKTIQKDLLKYINQNEQTETT